MPFFWEGPLCNIFQNNKTNFYRRWQNIENKTFKFRGILIWWLSATTKTTNIKCHQ